MVDDLTVLGPDGIRRSYDEHYDTMMDVEQDPTGAFFAIQKQAYRIGALEAKLERISQAWAVAIYADLDHGMASLSEKTVAEFAMRYPAIASFSRDLFDILIEGEPE